MKDMLLVRVTLMLNTDLLQPAIMLKEDNHSLFETISKLCAYITYRIQEDTIKCLLC